MNYNDVPLIESIHSSARRASVNSNSFASVKQRSVIQPTPRSISLSSSTTNSTFQNTSPAGSNPPGSGFIRSMLYTTPSKKFSSFVPLNDGKQLTAPSSINSASLRGYDAGSVSPDSPTGTTDSQTNNEMLYSNQQTRVFQPNESYSIL